MIKPITFKTIFFCKILLLLLLLLLLGGCANLQETPLSGTVQTTPELGVRLRVEAPGNLPAEIVGNRQRVLLVVRVKAGQAAEQAGIQVGDILLELDGSAISGMADSVAVMQRLNRGDSVLATVLRNGELKRIPVRL